MFLSYRSLTTVTLAELRAAKQDNSIMSSVTNQLASPCRQRESEKEREFLVVVVVFKQATQNNDRANFSSAASPYG